MAGRTGLVCAAMALGCGCGELDGRADAGDLIALDLDAGDGCAAAPLGDLAGEARVELMRDGTGIVVAARVRLSPVDRTACVDIYLPAGTVSFVSATAGCTTSVAPAEAAIAPTDGALLLDRSTSPATYVATASSLWLASYTTRCDGDAATVAVWPAGGTWLLAGGALERGRLAGRSTSFGYLADWDLAPAD